MCSRVVGGPDPGMKGLADAEADGERDGQNQGDDADLDYYPVALAHLGEHLAGVAIDAGGLCLLFPVVLSRPHLTVWASLDGRVGSRLHATRVVSAHQRASGHHGLQVGVKGVETVIVSGGWGRDLRQAARIVVGRDSDGSAGGNLERSGGCNGRRLVGIHSCGGDCGTHLFVWRGHVAAGGSVGGAACSVDGRRTEREGAAAITMRVKRSDARSGEASLGSVALVQAWLRWRVRKRVQVSTTVDECKTELCSEPVNIEAEGNTTGRGP